MTTRPRNRRRPAPGAPPLDAELAQLRALAHPLRLQLIQLFAASPRTVREAAESLDLPRTRLYHHVALLEEAGLLRVRETRPHRGAVEQVYEPVRQPPHEPRSRQREPLRIPPALAHAVMERARADLVSALAGPSASSVRLIHLIAGDRQFVAAVRRHIHAIAVEAQRAAERAASHDAAKPRRRSTDRWSLTVSFVPTDT